MTAQPSLSICTVGTDETISPPRQLVAGPVTVEFDNGAIRHIKCAGIEVLRGIAFLIRNVNWGTYAPVITDIQITEQDGGFSLSYNARCADDHQAVRYRADITGTAEGTLSFVVEGTTETEFATNRLGFVVLHPLVGVAGQPLVVTHTDGDHENTEFPATISPSQPVFDIRTLSHQVCPGVTAACTMRGDAFEMEDQRNWTDASYKTYIRPLSKPLPYTVAANAEVRQSVTLAFTGQPEFAPDAASDRAVSIAVGLPSDNAMPRIGLAVDHATAAPALASPLVAAAGAQDLVCQVDLRHQDLSAINQYAALAESTGAAVTLELIVPDDADPAQVAATAAGIVQHAGLSPAAVAISPAGYLMSYQPDAVWPDLPPLEAYYDAVRGAFPDAAVGGGMFSYFTELNRKRPPAQAVDFVTHTTCPIVHDADDRAVMESLEALQYVIATTRSFMGDDLPYRVGPSTIGMRQNPYGAAPADNPDNGRVAMATADPRHRALFGAAWTVGYAAEMVRGGVDVLTLAAATGRTGIIHGRGADPVPYYDADNGDGQVYPLYHVVRGLAAAAGAAARTLDISDPTRVQGLAFDTPDGVQLWLANLHPEPTQVALTGIPGDLTVRNLDATTFPTATADPSGFWQQPATPSESTVHLAAYAVAIVATV